MISRSILLALALCAVAFAEEGCLFMTSMDGVDYAYDLSAMTRPKTGGYHATGVSDDGEDTYDFSVNFCGLVACGQKELSPFAAACQAYPYRDDPSKIHHRVLGQRQHIKMSPGMAGVNNGVQVEYSQGASCSQNNVNRTVQIQVVCDPLVTPDEAVLEYVGESTYCEYRFSIACSAGCPIDGGETNVPGGTSGFAIFGIVVLVIIVVFTLYCIIGIVINRKAGKTEEEQIPNHKFWFGILKCKCLPGGN